jgi:protein kinase-like protein
MSLERREESRGSPSGELARQLFEEALRLPPEERPRFVEQRTRGDAALGAEVEGLLASEAALGSFLERPWAPARARLLADGARIGEHEIEAYLGGGGGGQVYRARELATGRTVALKVAALTGLAPQDRERFLRGTHIAAAIRHRSLVEVYASGTDVERGLVFCSMRLVSGVSLQEVLAELVERDSPPVGAERRALVERLAEVASALGALHAQGVVHRDVKPANVMLEGGAQEAPWSGHAVLVDFGLVRSLHDDSRTSILGTLPYLAPEVLLEGRADARADVYALGLCLRDLLAARFPGARGGPRGELTPLRARVPDLDAELEAIVERALEPDPEHRHADGRELAAELERWLAEESDLVRALRRLRRLPARALRGSLGTWTAASVVLLGLAVMQATSVLRGRAREVHAAYESGDLLAFERAAERVPERLQGALLPSALLAPLASLHDPLSPEADVVRLAADREDALLQAARHLGRSGLASQGTLARFLLQAIDTDPGVALRLCARLFFEYPCEDRDTVRAAEPFRTRLLEALSDRDVPDGDKIFALTALGGSGDPSTCERLVAWLADRPTDSPLMLEEIRLVARALELVVRRSESAGFRPELARLDWDALLSELLRARTRERAAGRQNPDLGVARAFEALACTVAVCRTTEKLPPLRVDPSAAIEHPAVFRAANRDPALAADPRQALAQVTELDESDTHAAWGTYLAAGRALALLGLPSDHAWLVESLKAPVDTRERILFEVLEREWGAKESPYECLDEHLRPDAETRLGAWFDQAAAPWISRKNMSSMTPPDVAPDAIASWTFLADGLHLLGEAIEVRSHAVTFKPDDPVSSSTFACLGVGGMSELHILFCLRSEEALVLRVQVQKGVRTWLPFEGEATAIVNFDNAEQSFPVTDSACRTLPFPIQPRLGTEDGLRSLSIRLADSSTTTLRIYRIEIAPQDD